MTNDSSYWYVKIFVNFFIYKKAHSSYMTLHPIPSEFPYIWGKFSFLFYQCALLSQNHFNVHSAVLHVQSSFFKSTCFTIGKCFYPRPKLCTLETVPTDVHTSSLTLSRARFSRASIRAACWNPAASVPASSVSSASSPSSPSAPPSRKSRLWRINNIVEVQIALC